jgi:hypothetical protein
VEPVTRRDGLRLQSDVSNISVNRQRTGQK